MLNKLEFKTLLFLIKNIKHFFLNLFELCQVKIQQFQFLELLLYYHIKEIFLTKFFKSPFPWLFYKIGKT